MAENAGVTEPRICKSYFVTCHTHPSMDHRYAGMWGAPGIPSQWARDRDGRVQDFLTRDGAIAAASVCLCAALSRARRPKTVIVKPRVPRAANSNAQTIDHVFANFK